MELIEIFCSMHLGANLRLAFLSGTTDTEQCERYHKVDVLVHEFCKLFGKTAGPEYACGTLSFPDFLELRISSSNGQQQVYYQTCLKLKLHRQIGSRYFVAACNATKILFLKEAAIEFLKYTNKDKTGNKLERDIFSKLHDPAELIQLKADCLMYYHIYSDLYMLSKSNELGLSVFCMNKHYLELFNFLSEVETSPEIVFDLNYRVFPSEEWLYSSCSKVNHRLHSCAAAVYETLFDSLAVDSDRLTALLIAGCSKMKAKLSSYAHDQLPGGRYWDPDEQLKKVLRELRPSNDVCESILGLNDYLTTTLPNLHQVARSNLVQIKRNKTLKWLSSLPEEEQDKVVDLAVKRRRLVHQECQEEEKMQSRQRQQKMMEEHTKRLALERKQREEREKLSQFHLVTSSDELEEELLAIKKKSEKIKFLRTQVQIRRKLLCQTVPIAFTANRKQRPIEDIVKELCDVIEKDILPAECQSFIKNPTSLIGRRIRHRFVDEESNTSNWYMGTVTDYSFQSRSHTLTYEGESPLYEFDITLDLILGDLIIL